MVAVSSVAVWSGYVILKTPKLPSYLQMELSGFFPLKTLNNLLICSVSIAKKCLFRSTESFVFHAKAARLKDYVITSTKFMWKSSTEFPVCNFISVKTIDKRRFRADISKHKSECLFSVSEAYYLSTMA